MTAAPEKCPVCNGRGYIRCECWPADCICGFDDEYCDWCQGTGDGDFDEDEMGYEPGGPHDPAIHREGRNG